jgi:hypothetical protein
MFIGFDRERPSSDVRVVSGIYKRMFHHSSRSSVRLARSAKLQLNRCGSAVIRDSGRIRQNAVFSAASNSVLFLGVFGPVTPVYF